MMNSHLISDPEERKKRAEYKESSCLAFLRDEIYSTTSILAKKMGVGDRAARTVLTRMEKKRLVVRDEVKFMGSKAVPLWGITMDGVMQGLTPEEVAEIKLRYHVVGRVSPLTIAHTLDVQKYRLYCESELGYRSWVPTRLLPAMNAKKTDPKRWAVYPDGVAIAPSKASQTVRVALEIERTRKTPQRYVQIINGHLRNIKEGWYQRVVYVCITQKESDSLRALFYRLMNEKSISVVIGDHKYRADDCIKLFRFKSMEDLTAS